MRNTSPEESNPLAVLFVTYGLTVGGAERLLVKLINALDRRRFTPTLVTLGPPTPLEETLASDVRIIRAQRRHKFDLSPAGVIARLLASERIDRIFALDFFSNLFVMVAKKRANVRTTTLVSLHATKPRSAKDFIQTMVYARLLGRDEKLVTVSTTQASFLSRLYRIAPWRFHTIHNGVDINFWTLAPDEFDSANERSLLGISRAAKVLVHVAVFRKEKNQLLAVRALAEFHKRFSKDAFLILVGGGDVAMQNSVHLLAESLGVGSFVRICGHQSDHRPLLWMSDIFTLSSRTETFPLAAVEAMATGLPCVLPNLGGAAELIAPGQNGFICQTDNAASMALAWKNALEMADGVSRQTIRDSIQNKFSFDRCVAMYEAEIAEF